MNKKVGEETSFLIFFLQSILVIGFVIFHKLSNTRMGVMRHVVYKSQKWESALDMQALCYLLSVLFLLFAIWGIYCGAKANSIFIKGNWITLVILSILAIVFNLFLSRHEIYIYYYTQIIWGGLLGLQLLHCQLISSNK